MPGVTGLVLAILVGRFLQTRRNIVPWYSLARLLFIACFGLTGLLAMLLPEGILIPATLGIWAFATLPSVALTVAFSVVMNAVAGPKGRYSLLSRRWAIFGVTGVIGTFLVTRVINLVEFPFNYAYMFLGLSLGGLVSYYFSNRITIPDQPPTASQRTPSLRLGLKNYRDLIRTSPAFISFSLKRFVYQSAMAISVPLMPLFLVRSVEATDAQIGMITMVFSLTTLAGYFIWAQLSRLKGGRFVLLATTLGMVFYPGLSALAGEVSWILVFAGVAGLFAAGLDLVFFDELMKTVPVDQSATFVSLAQSMQYLSAILAPMLATLLAEAIGLEGALITGSVLRFLGYLLFLKKERVKAINAAS
jgi:hypothetical protein